MTTKEMNEQEADYKMHSLMSQVFMALLKENMRAPTATELHEYVKKYISDNNLSVKSPPKKKILEYLVTARRTNIVDAVLNRYSPVFEAVFLKMASDAINGSFAAQKEFMRLYANKTVLEESEEEFEQPLLFGSDFESDLFEEEEDEE